LADPADDTGLCTLDSCVISGPVERMTMRRSGPLHQQWLSRAKRRIDDPYYREEWWAEQCGGCRFWLELAGPMGLDYGGCSNAVSPFFGLIRFEHDGCDAFDRGGPWHDAPNDVAGR
jgi:hypothetical protein